MAGKNLPSDFCWYILNVREQDLLYVNEVLAIW